MDAATVMNKTVVLGRPHISLDFVVKNDSLAGESSNEYIKSFCHDGDMLERIYNIMATDTSILKLMNKQGLKKELTECYSAICLVERSFRRHSMSTDKKLGDCTLKYCVPCVHVKSTQSVKESIILDCGNAESLLTFKKIRENIANIVFYDICSGKGILSFLLSLLFPDLQKIVMIDSDANMKLEHLASECCSSIIYRQCDIYSEDFSEYLLSESRSCRLHNQIPVLIGLHLCGTLSTRLIHLYNTIEDLPILILSPCCAPTRSKKNKVFMSRDRLKKNKWSSYSYWSMSVYMFIDHLLAVKDIIHDDLVISEKNTYICALKRYFLSIPSRKTVVDDHHNRSSLIE